MEHLRVYLDWDTSILIFQFIPPFNYKPFTLKEINDPRIKVSNLHALARCVSSDKNRDDDERIEILEYCREQGAIFNADCIMHSATLKTVKYFDNLLFGFDVEMHCRCVWNAFKLNDMSVVEYCETKVSDIIKEDYDTDIDIDTDTWHYSIGDMCTFIKCGMEASSYYGNFDQVKYFKDKLDSQRRDYDYSMFPLNQTKQKSGYFISEYNVAQLCMRNAAGGNQIEIMKYFEKILNDLIRARLRDVNRDVNRDDALLVENKHNDEYIDSSDNFEDITHTDASSSNKIITYTYTDSSNEFEDMALFHLINEAPSWKDAPSLSDERISLFGNDLWLICMIRCVRHDSLITLKYCEDRIISNKLRLGHGDVCKVPHEYWLKLIRHSPLNSISYGYCQSRAKDEQCEICMCEKMLNSDFSSCMSLNLKPYEDDHNYDPHNCPDYCCDDGEASSDDECRF